MANETELERLVVRLTGDSVEFQRMCQQASIAANQTAEQVQKAGEQIEKSLAGKLQGLGASISGFGHAIKSMMAPIEGLRNDSFDAFSEAELISIKLNATLAANGRNVQLVRAQYDKFAEKMQEMTVLDDDAILGLLKMAESFSLTGEAAQQATQQAMQLASINGSSAESMMRVTAAMAQGDIKRAMMFSRMIPQLRGVRDETEFMAKYTALAAAGQEVLTKEANTCAGQLKQLANVFGNLKEKLGEAIAEQLKPWVTWLKELASKFMDVSKEVWSFIARVTGILVVIGPVVIAVGSFVGFLGFALASITALASPIAILILGLIALTGKVLTANDAWKLIWDTMVEWGTNVIGFLGNLATNMDRLWTALQTNAIAVFNWLSDNWRVMWERFPEIAMSIMGTVVTILGMALTQIGALIYDEVAAPFEWAWRQVSNRWTALAATLAVGVLSLVINIRDAFQEVVAVNWGVLNGIKMAWIKTYTLLGEHVLAVSNLIGSYAKMIGLDFGALWKGLISGFGTVFNFITTRIENVGTFFKVFGRAVLDTIQNIKGETQTAADAATAAADAASAPTKTNPAMAALQANIEAQKKVLTQGGSDIGKAFIDGYVDGHDKMLSSIQKQDTFGNELKDRAANSIQAYKEAREAIANDPGIRGGTKTAKPMGEFFSALNQTAKDGVKTFENIVAPLPGMITPEFDYTMPDLFKSLDIAKSGADAAGAVGAAQKEIGAALGDNTAISAGTAEYRKLIRNTIGNVTGAGAGAAAAKAAAQGASIPAKMLQEGRRINNLAGGGDHVKRMLNEGSGVYSKIRQSENAKGKTESTNPAIAFLERMVKGIETLVTRDPLQVQTSDIGQ